MTMKVQVDWDKNGNYTGAFDTVTSRVRRDARMTFEYGRDQSTALAPTVAGRGQFTLDNADRRYMTRNTASPLFGLIKPARPVKVTRTVSGVDYILFVGHTDDQPINPDPNSKSVTFSLVDSLADFRDLNISTALYSGVRTGQAIGYVLDACGWTAGRDLDSGSTVMPWWWEDNSDAFTALETLVRCEGPPAMITIGADGSFIFKDRHHRLLDSASITSQGTWRDIAGTEPTMTKPFIYDDAWRNIINHGLITVEVRTLRALAVVWSVDSPLGFTASETKTFIATASDPFMNAVTPVAGTDYTVNSGSLSSVTLSRTSGGSTTITIAAGGGGAQLSNLQLRAQPVQVAYTQQVTASNSTSITAYGQRSFPGDLPFCNIYDADAVIQAAVQMRKDPLPIVNVNFMVGNNTTRAALILTRNLSDQVTVVEPKTALNDAFFVESIAHDMSGEFDHTVMIGLEHAPPAGTVTSSNVFIVGGGVGHRIGDGKLAA